MRLLRHFLRTHTRLIFSDPWGLALALLTLAMVFAANVTFSSVLDAVLLKPLPYPEPDRLISLREVQEKNAGENWVSTGSFHFVQERVSVIQSMALARERTFNLSHASEPQRVRGMEVGPDYFAVLGVNPMLGRGFESTEAGAEDSRVVILSHELWQENFAGSAECLGKSLSLDDVPHRIIGVMPDWLVLPNRIRLWAPLALAPAAKAERRTRYHDAIARISPAATLVQVQAELDGVSRAQAELYPATNRGWSVRAKPLRSLYEQNSRGTFGLIAIAVFAALAIATLNVSTLILTRVLAARRQQAICLALGASRRQVVQPILVEVALLVGAGSALGLLLAHVSLSSLVALAPSGLFRVASPALDLRVAGYTLGVALLTAAVAGFLPAWRATKADPIDALKNESHASESKSARRLREAILLGQVALAVGLLILAGTLIKGFAKLQALDMGFSSERVVTHFTALSSTRYGQPDKQREFARQWVNRLRTLDGIEHVGISQLTPLSSEYKVPYVISGQAPQAIGEQARATYYTASPGYFSAMRIPLKAGRFFREEDNEFAPRVALINETMARTRFPGQDPVGKKFVLSYGAAIEREIVGVVGDVRENIEGGAVTDQIYEPFFQQPFPSFTLVVKFQNYEAMAARWPALLRQAMNEVDPTQPTPSIRPFQQTLESAQAKARLATRLLAIFAGLGGVVALAGIFGQVAYGVSQRRVEYGIHFALGAQPNDILRRILKHNLALLSVGIGLGLVAAMSAGRLIDALFYGVEAWDARLYGGVAVGFLVPSVMVCFLAARKVASFKEDAALRAQ